jgi:hypothetical protein
MVSAFALCDNMVDALTGIDPINLSAQLFRLLRAWSNGFVTDYAWCIRFRLRLC